MADHNNHQRKLKSFLILPNFQLRLIALNIISSVGFLGFAYFGIKRSFGYVSNLGLKAQLAPQHPFFSFQELQERHVFTYLLASAFAFTVLNTILTLVVSHRLSGPLFRLKKELIKVKETGTFSTVQFRKGDYTENVDVLLNEAFAAVSDKSNHERKAS